MIFLKEKICKLTLISKKTKNYHAEFIRSSRLEFLKIQRMYSLKINSSKIICRVLKAFSDGSLGASTAWFFEPYENTNSFGLPQDIVINGKLEELAFKADRKNLQMAVHAIGDKANAFILDLYEKIIKKNKYRNRRFRIEHAQHLRFQDIEKFVKNKL